MKKLIVGAAVLGALSVGCGGPQIRRTNAAPSYPTDYVTAFEDITPQITSRAPTAKARPSDPAVYARIQSLTDCKAIRREWDTAIANTTRNLDAWEATKDPSRLALADVTQSYSDAAEARMHETGCYSQ